MSFLMIVHVPNESISDIALATKKKDSLEILETNDKNSVSDEEDITESGDTSH